MQKAEVESIFVEFFQVRQNESCCVKWHIYDYLQSELHIGYQKTQFAPDVIHVYSYSIKVY
jgi:hypothetical protein